MTIYYTAISMLTGLGYVLMKRKKETNKTTAIYMAVSFLVLFFLASFRYGIGFDYFSYQDIYRTVSELSFYDIMEFYGKEPLFYFVCKLFCIVGCPYHVFLVCLNIFLLFVAMRFIYCYSKIPWVSVFLYITLQFLAYNMNLIRQSIALAFFMLAYPYIKNRRIVPFTILIILGGLFHNTLLFIFPFYFLLVKENTKKFTISMLVFTVFAYLLFDPFFDAVLSFFPENYANYKEGYFWNPSTFDYVVFPALYCILIYLFQSRIAEKAKRSLYLNSALYTFLISLFVTKHFILERFSIYPFVFSIIAIPEIICSYESKGEVKQDIRYYSVFFLFLLFGMLYFLFAVSKGFHHVYPYFSLLDRAY